MPKKVTIVKQNYPPIPDDASILDVVEEYYTYIDDKGKPQRVFVGAAYCPRDPVGDDREPFDPTTPAAQMALVKLRKEAKRMKRYDRDIKRRRSEAPLQETRSESA